MARLLKVFESAAVGKQGLIAAVKSDNDVFLVHEEIDQGVDAEQWCIDNHAQIVADIATNGTLVDPDILLRKMENEGKDASEIVDAIDDIAKAFSSKSEAKAYAALVLLMVEQINNLRSEHGLANITPAQAKQALINKYKSL